jgi:hypothetical protein
MTPGPHDSSKTVIVGYTSHKGGEIFDLGLPVCISSFELAEATNAVAARKFGRTLGGPRPIDSGRRPKKQDRHPPEAAAF